MTTTTITLRIDTEDIMTDAEIAVLVEKIIDVGQADARETSEDDAFDDEDRAESREAAELAITINPPMPDAVRAALAHVRHHHPEVCQVFFGIDQRWHYCGEAFESPVFGPEIDQTILEDAADAVTSLPAAYTVGEA